MIAGTDIKKSFEQGEILHGVDIKIEPGNITALIGPSGSGKTTLLRALSLLDPPDSGTVSVDETTFKFPLENGNNIKKIWPRVTVVFQQFFLWPHLTLRENITLPMKNNGGGNQDQLNELIDIFDMRGFIDRYPNEVSIGQRQRAAIVRALILNPSYILLDEITSALDVEHVSAILSYLQLLREKGIGIFIITHLIGFARRTADQICFIDDGKIIEAGSPDILSSTKNERVRRFLKVIETAT